MDKKELKEWDKIFARRDELIEENPAMKKFGRFKTFKDEESEVRCTKCGATEDIGGCPECKEEKAYLKKRDS